MKDISDKKAWWIIGIMAFVFMIPHSMAPWGNGNYPTDVCVYTRCAMWMNDGLVMYRDMFDHKGPLVYIVYWISTLVFGMHGIWLMDILICLVTFALFYRIARLYNDTYQSLLITGLMAMYFQLPFTDGGGPEWIATIGCSYTAWIFAKHLKDGDYCSFTEMALLSAAVGICLLTKFNTSAGIIPIAAFFLWHLIRYWDTHVFIRYCGAVITGLLIVFIPLAYWLHAQGNLSEFIDCYWLFNTQKYENEMAIPRNVAVLTITLVCIPAYLFYGLYAWHNRHNREQLFWVTASIVIPLALNGYVKNGYPHYLFPCFAIFSLPLTICWKQINDKCLWRTIVISLCLLIGVVTFGVRAYLRTFPFDTSHDREVALLLNEQREESEYVMVYPFVDRTMYRVMDPEYCYTYRLWLLVDGKPASKYFYFPPGMSTEMHEESWREITEHAPRWVVAHEQNSEDILRLGYEIYKQEPSGYQILKKK